MTTAYLNSMQSAIGNANQKSRTLLGSNNCQGQQQFIVAIPSDQNSNNNNGDMDNSVAAHNNILYQQQVYPDYSQPGLYTTVSSGGYYDSQGNAQIMNHNGDTFIVHHGMTENEATATLPHTIRAAPVSVQWLRENYEPCKDVSLPRAILYNHYLSHCAQAKLDPMNPASFGKLIRAIFPELKTRRLGTRGNSQYHYQGIRIKSMSALNQVGDHFNSRVSNYHHHHHHHYHHHNHGGLKRKALDNDGNVDGDASNPSSGHRNALQQQNNQDFLGDVPPGATDFGEVDVLAEMLPEGLVLDDVRAFETLYKDHCERIMEMVVNLQFNQVESLWRQFWCSDPSDERMGDSEMNLGREKLCELASLPQVVGYIRRADCKFYQSLVSVLIPVILRPVPCSLTQGIRNFAKYLTEWMEAAVAGMPEKVIEVKVGVVKALAQILRRYTSLNHLAQAARAVLQNPSQVAQMLADINKIDFGNVQEQASWVCECDPEVVSRLEQDFKKILQQQTSLEQWAVWLDDAVTSALEPHAGEGRTFVRTAKRFLVNWSYYSSLVIRDLTLRSAASFGSFHLIHLLYNEYIFYLVEHKVASVLGQTPISVVCPEEGDEAGIEEMKEFPESREEKQKVSPPQIVRQLTAQHSGQSSLIGANTQFLVPSSSSSNTTLLLTKAATSSSSSSSLFQFPSASAKTVTISFANQTSADHTKTNPSTSGTKVTLVSNVQQSTPKTIIVVPVSSSVNPSLDRHLASGIQLIPGLGKRTKSD